MEGCIRRNDLFHKTGRTHNGFKDRSRLINDSYTAVHIGLAGGVGKVIGIKGRPACHPQDFSRIGIHKDCRGACRLCLFDGVVKSALQDELHARINGQLYSIFPLDLDLIQTGGSNEVALGIRVIGLLFLDAAQISIHGSFHALKSFIIDSNKSDDLRCKVIFGIIPFTFLNKMESRDLFFVQHLRDFLSNMGIQGPFHPKEHMLLIGKKLHEL